MSRFNKPNNSVNSILGPEVEIQGDIQTDGNMIIYGKVFGNIEAKGHISTGKGSFIKGNIKANTSTINGSVEGDVLTDGKVVLGNHSLLMGNLKAAILVIEEGARFEGICNMTDQPAVLINEINQPQLDIK